MSNYKPQPAPLDSKDIPSYLYRELDRVGRNLADDAEHVFYRTLPFTEASISAGLSANYKIALANVIRISASITQTLTGIAYKVPNREVVLVNIGTSVLALKSEGTESSASFRFSLASNWQLSANASIVLWYDGVSTRWRALGK